MKGTTTVSGHHHQGTANPPDPRLRLRLYVGGELRDETWLDATDPRAQDIATATSHMHQAACEAATAAGLKWRIEVYDPEASADDAILTIGTDLDGPTTPLWGDQ